MSESNIRQEIFKNITAGNIHTGDISQTINIYKEQYETTGIPKNVPYRRTPYFVGRSEETNKIHSILQQTKNSKIPALVGMGGVGKTEIAVQYIQDHLNDYPGGICWLQVQAESLELQILRYVSLVLSLEIPQSKNGKSLSVQEQITWCWNYWNPAGTVLIVIDNITDIDCLKEIIKAPLERFKILLLTRFKGLSINIIELEINPLSFELSLDLFKNIIGNQIFLDNKYSAIEICKKLDGLPLAIELIGRFIKNNEQQPLSNLLSKLDKNGIEEESLNISYPLMNSDKICSSIFEIAWEELDLYTKNIARILSWFSPNLIYLELIEEIVKNLTGESFHILSSINKLDSISIIQNNLFIEYSVTLHPLIRDFLQKKDVKNEFNLIYSNNNLKKEITNFFLRLLEKIGWENELICNNYLNHTIPHLIEFNEKYINLVDDYDFNFSRGISLIFKGQGVYTQSIHYYKKVLNNNLIRYSEDSLFISSRFHEIGVIYMLQGMYKESEEYLNKSLKIKQDNLGNDHFETQSILNSMAILYNYQSRYQDAQNIFLKNLKNQSVVNDFNNIVRLNNHALTCASMGELEEAEELLFKALEIAERICPEEFILPRILNSLGTLRYNQKRYDESEKYFTKSLNLKQKIFSSSHPSIAETLNNIALLYISMKRYDSAEIFLIKSLKMSQYYLGKENQEVARVYNHFGILYEEKKLYEKSELFYFKALNINQNILSDFHHHIAVDLRSIASLYHKASRFEEAEKYFLMSLSVFNNGLGSNHPETIKTNQAYEYFLFTRNWFLTRGSIMHRLRVIIHYIILIFSIPFLIIYQFIFWSAKLFIFF